MENTRILHYETGRLLGRGGMGEVVEARDTRLGRRVALKFIAPALASDPDAVRRFEREAHAAAALSHPHIATVYALEHDGGRLFIASELLTGGSLRARLRTRTTPVPEALALARDVASALAHAHGRGVVHRDIKPENLLFTAEGVLKVTDFGLARLAHGSQLTSPGATVGTAAYMAPESIRGEGGASADVFALGVVLYELLAGVQPFRAESTLALLYLIASSDPAPPSAHRSDLPPDVVALDLALLARSPADRPGVREALARLCALTGVPVPSETPAEPAAGDWSPADSESPTEGLAPARLAHAPGWRPAPSDADTQGMASTPPLPRRRRAAGIALAIGLGLALVAALLAWQHARREHAAAGERVLAARTLADEAGRFLTLGQLDSAQARATAALALLPDDAGARINLAQVLRAHGQPTRASALFAAVARDSAADARLRAVAWEALGDMALADRTWPEAVRALQLSFALDSSERAYSQLGYALVRSAQSSAALALLRRGLAAYPGSAALHKNAGLALLQLDSLAAARDQVDRAVALDPGFAPALGLRARIAARSGDRHAVAAAWRDYLAARPEPADSAETAAELARVAAAHAPR